MMKAIFLLVITLMSICFESFAQNEEEYYKPPSKRTDVRNNSYSNLDRKAQSLYLGIEGGFKLNYTSLSNNLGKLIQAENNNEAFWGVNIGYNFDNKWAIESGFMKNPVYYVQSVASGRGVPFSYRIGQNLPMIPLRFKYKLVTIDAITKSAILYVGAGVLIGANVKDKNIFSREFGGFSGSRVNPDTLKLVSESFLTNKAKVIFELQTELQGRVTNGFYISLFGRMNFGANGAVRSDLTYYINSNKIDGATQLLKGISYNFGLLLRIDLAKGYKYNSKVE